MSDPSSTSEGRRPSRRRQLLRTVTTWRLASALFVLLAVLAVRVCQRGHAGTRPAPPTDAGATFSRPDSVESASAGSTRTSSPNAGGATPRFGLRLIARGLDQPLYVTAPPNDTRRLFIVQKTGAVVILKDGKRLARPFLDVRRLISEGAEQGLLCLAFDPGYAVNRRFYVSYTDRHNNLVVARYVADRRHPDVADAGSALIVSSLSHPHTNHNGGQLAFGPDGLLYLGIGDGGKEGDPQLYGQNPHVLLAKILTFDLSAAHPKPTMYAYGLRNPWRFSFDSGNGDLWIGDVGQDRWEEIDFLPAGTPPGTNFGWSYYEGDHVFKRQPIDRSRLVFPVLEYPHTLGCAVVGGYVYRGHRIRALRGWYIFGDFCSGRVWVMAGPRGPARTSPISGKVKHISSFGQDARGEMYLVSLDGSVFMIVP